MVRSSSASSIARCYNAYDKSSELATEASEIADQLGDPVTRSYGYDVRCLTAVAARDWDDAADWARRRVSLVDEIDDPDHQQDIYSGAFSPVVALGQFDEGRRYSRSGKRSTAGSLLIIGCTASARAWCSKSSSVTGRQRAGCSRA